MLRIFLVQYLIKNKLISNGYKVDLLNNRINLKKVIKKKYDFIISSGYPYKITGDIITKFKNNIINLHATFLPWGKGIGTTFFSFLLFQPIGVSIHFINKKYDMGNIICRIRVKEKKNDTTRSYYRRILSKLEKIFIKNSKKIINQNIASKNQKKFNVRPQYFSRDNFESIMRNLPNGYDTKLKDLSIHGAIINNNIKFINYLK